MAYDYLHISIEILIAEKSTLHFLIEWECRNFAPFTREVGVSTKPFSGLAFPSEDGTFNYTLFPIPTPTNHFFFFRNIIIADFLYQWYHSILCHPGFFSPFSCTSFASEFWLSSAICKNECFKIKKCNTIIKKFINIWATFIL